MAEQLPVLAMRLGRLLQKGSSSCRQLSGALSSFQTTSTSTSSLSRAAFGQQLRSYADYPPHTLMTMPALSPTMSQGNIAKWKKKEGDTIAPGQIIAEVETDKATMEWEAQEEGYIAKFLKPEGSKDIPIGTNLIVLVEDESAVAAFKDYKEAAAAPAAAAKPAAAPAPPKAAAPAAPAKPAGNFPPHQVLNMPALSPTMHQGNILEWKKKVGDHVAAGEVYCEVETDKATISWESQEDGYIAQILAPGGTKDLPIGTPVLIMVDEKEAVAAFSSYTKADASGAPAAAPAAAPKAAAPAAPAPPAAAPKAAPAAAAAAAASGERVRASPYARKLAAQSGVASLAGVAGTGPGGRIVAEDVQKGIASGAVSADAVPAAASAAAPSAAAPRAAGAPAAAAPGASYMDIPHSQIRRVTAQRLMESKQTIPHYYLSVECQVDAMMKLREQINSSGAKGVKISVNDFVLKAAALALKKVPGVNASWQPDFIRQYNSVDISVAVQTPTGLITPIVKDADLKGLSAISADVKALAGKAKEGKLSPAEFMGGTFTISNLGMFGVKQFAAIINPPQAAILAVGGTQKKVILDKAGKFVEVGTMTVTLSCDHRVIDGAMGAEWLAAFRSYVEEPYTMLL